MNYYYLDTQNKTTGPVTLGALQALIRDGGVKPDPMVIPEGGSEWKPLSVYNMAGAGAPAAVPAGASSGAAQFCPKCGTRQTGNATFCSSCGAPLGGGQQAGAAVDKVKVASQDALVAFKVFAANPVGGLSAAFEGLGPARALGVGITFGAVFAISILLAIYRMTSNLGMFSIPHNFSFFMKALLLSVMPFAGLFGTSSVARISMKGQGSFGHDSFIAGASSLPLAIVALLAAILGDGNSQIIGFFGVFGICLLVLMLFTGLVRISKITERLATIAVPSMLIVTGFLCKIVGQAMLNSYVNGLLN
jgi:hypothetical protein